MRLLFYSASSPSLSPSAPSEWSTGSPILQHGKEKLNLQHRCTLNHKRYGVYMFITPLLLLPLLASSYAEVNYEGVKVIQVFLLEISRLLIILFFSRVSFQLRRGCTCSNTFTATLSRWPYMVTPYPTAQSVFNKCFYTKENVAIINRHKKNS